MVHHPLKGVKFRCHLLSEILHFGVLDDLQAFRQLVLVVHGGHLKVAFHLLFHLLEAIHDGNT